MGCAVSRAPLNCRRLFTVQQVSVFVCRASKKKLKSTETQNYGVRVE